MSSKSSSSSSSKSFIARCSKHHVSSRIVYIHIDFSHEIVSNSLSLSHQKERDQISRRKKKTLKKQLRERRIERRNKLSSSLYFRTVTTCPSLSCMSLTGTPTPFPLRPTLLLVLMTTDDTLFLNNNKEEENRSTKKLYRKRVQKKEEVFFLYCLGFVSLGFVSRVGFR